MKLTQSTDSFKAIGCYSNVITVSSFVMGKLRAATFIRFRHIEPQLSVAATGPNLDDDGVHDTICYYGNKCLRSMKFSSTSLTTGPSTSASIPWPIAVNAPEETYGFNLEEAFPAIILAH